VHIPLERSPSWLCPSGRVPLFALTPTEHLPRRLANIPAVALRPTTHYP
jgi:hypothetical protein